MRSVPIAADTAVRVVVIAGAGPAFCAGHDLREVRANTDEAFYTRLFATCSRTCGMWGPSPTRTS